MNGTTANSPSKLTAAAEQYLEQYGGPIVTNSYLRIALAALSLVCLGTLALAFRTQAMVQNFRPLVIRIDKLGRAQAVAYNTLAYKPQAAECQYFLSEWARLFYSRNQYTIRGDFARSLYFLDSSLASGWMNTQGQVIQKFLDDDTRPGIKIDVRQVALADLRQPPYRASIDFNEIAYNQSDDTVVTRHNFTVHVVFVFRRHVPAGMVPVNPLGLTITYFHRDQAF